MQCFKQCPSCKHEWADRDDFLSDPRMQLVGYQVNFGRLKAGFFLFNHDLPECGTSLAIAAGAFVDMHDGPIFEERHETPPDCPKFCLDRRSLENCDKHCECAYVRDVLQRVKTWPKRDV